jgi:16S rRNA (guanine527-N7)-methyltransferase
MSSFDDPFAGFPLEAAISKRGAAAGIDLGDRAAGLAAHARAVLRADPRLHLTAVTDPAQFLERHLGESFEGAALLDPGAAGILLDLGSGNGYPGLPLAAARALLRPLLAEASVRKAEFLRGALAEAGFADGRVFEGQLQRPSDLPPLEGPLRVVAARAAGGWERVLPRLHSILSGDGEILLWAGEEVEAVRRREVWRRFELVERRPLPGRERSWVWKFNISPRVW